MASVQGSPPAWGWRSSGGDRSGPGFLQEKAAQAPRFGAEPQKVTQKQQFSGFASNLAILGKFWNAAKGGKSGRNRFEGGGKAGMEYAVLIINGIQLSWLTWQV